MVLVWEILVFEIVMLNNFFKNKFNIVKLICVCLNICNCG